MTGLRSSPERLSPADRAELLDGARRSLDQLAGLITDLLDVSRVQAGALAVHLESVDVEELLPAALDHVGAGPGTVGLRIPDDVPPVRTDPVLLERVLVNLLSNALRHSPADRPAELTLSRFGGVVEVRVIDHGPGIDAERRRRLFQPFQHEDDTSDSGGIGLGLALSLGFAEGMGATLTPEDTPGGGLTMVVGLPVDQVVREAAGA